MNAFNTKTPFFMYISPINFERDFYAFVCNQGFYANFAPCFFSTI